MPSQYPPYSTARHSAIEARRASRGTSRDGQQRHSGEPSPYRQQQYVEQQNNTKSGEQSPYRQQHYVEQQNNTRSGEQSPYRQQHYVEQQSNTKQKTRTIRGHFVAMLGEFIGTTMFLWFALAGTQSAATLTTNTDLDILRVFYISLVFGLSLLVCAWAFYRISGGLFNPAVTIGMCVAGQMPLMRAVFIFPAQVLGGMAAAGLVSCMFPGSIALTITNLTNGTSIARGLFIETFGTFILVFTILMLAAEKNHARAMAPVGIGLALFIGELAAVPYTGGSFNPARSLGPSVAALSFPGYHYIYWIGPILGALLAACYHRLLKALHYEEAQPGQDAPHGEAQIKHERREIHRHSKHQH